MIPDPEECIALLEKAGCSDDVIEHGLAVQDLAMAMASRTDVDDDVVQAGALLHDIGRAFDHGPDHVPEGVAFLEEEGVDECVVDCVARHMGAGLTAKEAGELGFPDGIWAPQLMEEKIVAHADNLTQGTAYRDVGSATDKLESEGLEEAAARVRRLHGALQDALGEDPSTIAAQLDA